MNEPLRVGGATMKWDDAVSYILEYTSNKNLTWSYPAYDGYPGHSSAELGLADLPAVSLLNAGQRAIISYYGMADMLPELNLRLEHPKVTGSFEDADSDTLEAIARLFDVAWEFPKPHVRLTKLAKVLHRKRPQLLPLYDECIRQCYQEIGDPPIPTDPRRSRAGFLRALLPDIQRDLIDQLPAWEKLAALAPQDGPKVTPLRALDMVGWRLGSLHRTRAL
ncbi:DUF6308 family protein [Arthrobacter sp. UCD-GKA]|uniref:DUF6308 family protein n=1 Tax=Arthrobacter sp. UCD-GKA TaxID=1913576 RepID=UPI0011145FA7|nr:DUF6308 family protein [Arthrobacter sp. UCD-GKA]